MRQLDGQKQRWPLGTLLWLLENFMPLRSNVMRHAYYIQSHALVFLYLMQTLFLLIVEQRWESRWPLQV
jgi:hypothetical protein